MNTKDSIKLIIWLLSEARPYLDRGVPKASHGRELARQVDEVLAQTVADYAPPRELGELDLRDLPEAERELLRAHLGKEEAGRFCYGFASRGKVVVSNAPLEEVHLELVETSEPGISLLVGPTVKSLPIISFEEHVGVGFEYTVEDRRELCPGCGVAGELVEGSSSETGLEYSCPRESCSFDERWKVRPRHSIAVTT